VVEKMDTRLLILGALLIVVGIIRHFIPKGALPHIGYKIMVPGWIIAGVGVVLVIAGLILG
jgi:hypothetical protein